MKAKVLLLTYTLLLLLANKVYGIPANCQTVNATNPSLCDTCQVGFYLQQDKSRCNNNIAECIVYSGNNCTKCNGSYGVFNNGCVDNIPYCAVYKNSLNCKSCHSELGYQISTDGTSCYNTIPNCLVYLTSATCQFCQNSYSLSYDSTTCYISPTSDCNRVQSADIYTCSSCNSSFYLTSQNTCEMCKEAHCSACSSNGLCQQCINSAFSLLDGNCVCSQGYYSIPDFTSSNSNDFTCSQCQSKCQSCSSFDKCSTCKGNRKIEFNCECPSGYVEDESSGDCRRCQQGTYLFGQQCVQDCPIGYYNDQILRQCSLCDKINRNLDQCTKAVRASITQQNGQYLQLIFSENITTLNSHIQFQDCINASILTSNNNSDQQHMVVSSVDQKNYKIAFEGGQKYSEIQLIIQNIEPNCFQTASGQLIDYPIDIFPKYVTISPPENAQKDYDLAMKTMIYIMGGLILICSFFGIKLVSSLPIETIQVVFCLFFIDMFIPSHLDTMFKALDVYNFRILSYIFSGFNGLDLKRDENLFGYELRDQELSGRFFQRGGFVSCFFYNGLTYVLLITFFYLTYLLLSQTCLARYPYPLAKVGHIDSMSEKKVEDQNQSQRVDLIPRSEKAGMASPKLVFSKQQGEEKQSGQKQKQKQDEEKVFEEHRYEHEIFYLVQIVVHVVKISYIPLTFAAGLQIKNYSESDCINTFGFFCAIIALLFVAYACGILLYRDINRLIHITNIIPQTNLFIYQVSELNITNNKVNYFTRMQILSTYYSLLQPLSFSLSILLITWLDKNADILLYLLIVIHLFIFVIALHSPFHQASSNRLNIASISFILIILFGQLSMRQLSKQIVKEVSLISQQNLFSGIQYVSYFLVSVILLYVMLSLVYSFYMIHSLYRRTSISSKVAVTVFPTTTVNQASEINQASEAIQTKPNPNNANPLKIDNLYDKDASTNSNKQDLNSKKSPKQFALDSKTPVDRRKSMTDQQLRENGPKRLSLINQMQAHQQSASSLKQIFVAPRKSLSQLKSMEGANSQSSINEQVSTNPSSIQVIEFEELQKLVKENKKMEQKLTLIQQQQDVIMKQMKQKKSNQNSQSSVEISSHHSDSDNNESIEQKKKHSQAQSIDTIIEEEEQQKQYSEVGYRRKRRGQSQIPNTPPSLEKIKFMENEVFHFGDDINVDNTNKIMRDNSNKKQPTVLNQNKIHKAKTMILDQDQKQIFSYGANKENINRRESKQFSGKKKSIINQVQNVQQSSSSSDEADDENQDFWKNTRKEQLRKDKFHRAQSMINN